MPATSFASDIDAIFRLEVPIIVRIAERFATVDEVISWVPGLIIDMSKHADEELELLVNNVPIGLGTAVKIGENFGIRISYVGDLKAKIEAMSGDRSRAHNVGDGSAAHAGASPPPPSPIPGMSDEEAARVLDAVLGGQA